METISKIEKILKFNEQKGSIPFLNKAIIKIMEGVINENDLTLDEVKDVTLNVYKELYRKYDFELETFVYTNQTHNIISAINFLTQKNQIKSNAYILKLDIIMKLNYKQINIGDEISAINDYLSFNNKSVKTNQEPNLQQNNQIQNQNIQPVNQIQNQNIQPVNQVSFQNAQISEVTNENNLNLEGTPKYLRSMMLMQISVFIFLIISQVILQLKDREYYDFSTMASNLILILQIILCVVIIGISIMMLTSIKYFKSKKVLLIVHASISFLAVASIFAGYITYFIIGALIIYSIITLILVKWEKNS